MASAPPRELRCLVVEDSPMMRQQLVQAIGSIGRLNVTEAENGLDALQKLATGRFDIVLTDINMPVMDGLKLIKRVRTDATHRHAPIVVITTESADEDRQRALALGANEYLVKPIQAAKVIAAVRRLLDLRE